MYRQIESRAHPLIKQMAELKYRDARRERGLFIAEGEKLLSEALAAGIKIKYIFFTQKYEEQAVILGRGAQLIKTNDDIIKKLSESKTPQGIICAAELFETYDAAKIKNGKFLALDSASEPGNLGAVMRGAEAFGIDGLIISENSADIYSPKTLRGSMGSAFRIPVYICGNLSVDLTELKISGFGLYSLELGGGAKPISEVKFPGKCIAVLGNESFGVSSEISKICERIYIPMNGGVESLNLSVAAAVAALYMKGGLANEEL